MDRQDLQVGTPWRVSIPITSPMDIDVVIPEALQRDGSGNIANIGGQVHGYKSSIILLGFSYTVLTTGTASLSILSHEDPWLAGGDDPIWVDDFGSTAGRYTHDTQCMVALGESGFRRDAASPTNADGAKLQVVATSNITAGHILLYGIHTGDEAYRSRQNVTGSPVDFSA